MALTQANLTQGSALTVTNNVVTGTGVFDDLMEAVTTHLEAQYQLGRITGTDFATVYLGAMQSALSQSVTYTLGQESTNAAVVLQTKQGLKVDADKLLVDAQELLTDAQKVKVDADVVLTSKQGTLTDNQAATELKKALDIVNTTTNRSAAQATSEATAVKQRLLTDAQKLKVDADKLLVDKQVVKLTADIALGVKQGALIDAQELQADAQKLKTDQEKALLLQKTTTEYAQTLVTGNTTPNANSTMGKQVTLYGEQAKGFKWNADQKYLKTLLDAWAINISTAGVASTGVVAINATGTGNINTQITNAEPTG